MEKKKKGQKVGQPPTTQIPNQEQMQSNTATRWWKYLCRVASLEDYFHYLRKTIFNRFRVELSITTEFELDTFSSSDVCGTREVGYGSLLRV